MLTFVTVDAPAVTVTSPRTELDAQGLEGAGWTVTVTVTVVSMAEQMGASEEVRTDVVFVKVLVTMAGVEGVMML